MVGLLRRVDVIVAIDAADFLQFLFCAEFAERAEVRLDRFQLRFLVVGVIFGGELADLVQIGVRASFPA